LFGFDVPLFHFARSVGSSGVVLCPKLITEDQQGRAGERETEELWLLCLYGEDSGMTKETPKA